MDSKETLQPIANEQLKERLKELVGQRQEIQKFLIQAQVDIQIINGRILEIQYWIEKQEKGDHGER